MPDCRPSGHSVNDAIPEEIRSLQYTSVEEVATVIISLGRDCMLAKIDCKECLTNCASAPRTQASAGYDMGGQNERQPGSPIWAAVSTQNLMR